MIFYILIITTTKNINKRFFNLKWNIKILLIIKLELTIKGFSSFPSFNIYIDNYGLFNLYVILFNPRFYIFTKICKTKF